MNRREVRTRDPRSGFSLVEILVVLGIIAFLTAAIVVVLPRVSNASKIAATRATIKKVDELLNDRMNGFKRWIQTQDQLAGNGIPSYVDSGTLVEAGSNLALAKVLAIKKRFRENFCQVYTELPSTITNSNPRGSTHLAATDSAECLYLILTKGALFDTEPPSAADLRGLEIADTDGDGLFEIVDAWGHPLRFYRWPTRLLRAGVPPTTSQTLANAGAPNASYGIPISPQFPVAWQASAVHAVGDMVAPTPANFLTYRCTVAGTSGPSVPTWPNQPNQTVTDGSVTWTSTGIAGNSAQLFISSISFPTPTYPVALPTTIVQEVAGVTLAKDPDDPAGLIDMWTSGPQSSSAFATAFEQNYHTPDTYFTPLIVSMGPDEQLGLFEAPDTANFGNLCQPRSDLSSTDPAGVSAVFDNITNRQQ